MPSTPEAPYNHRPDGTNRITMSHDPAFSSAWPLADIVAGLREARADWRRQHGREGDAAERELPSADSLGRIVQALSGILFPLRLGPADLRQDSEDHYIHHTLGSALQDLQQQALLELRHAARHGGQRRADLEDEAHRIVQDFANTLPALRRLLDTDVLAAFQGDPAARSVDEVLVCYPGVLAMIHHRIAHRLYRAGLPLLARIIAEQAHSATGIDIHPGATIGSHFFIDHGTGVVIGETTIIGEHVRLYQAVTLGAKRFPVNDDGSLEKGQARHPIVEDDVVIYAGATVLGRITIGRGSIIGGNVWLTRSVPPGSNITQANALNEPCGWEE